MSKTALKPTKALYSDAIHAWNCTVVYEGTLIATNTNLYCRDPIFPGLSFEDGITKGEGEVLKVSIARMESWSIVQPATTEKYYGIDSENGMPVGAKAHVREGWHQQKDLNFMVVIYHVAWGE
jgi:hypothetical protein